MTIEIHYYVIDTSYLDEYFKIDGWCEEAAHARIKGMLVEAVSRGDILFVPLPVLFETANHIAQVKNATRRRELVSGFQRIVSSSINKNTPWTITPLGKSETIRELMAALEGVNRFADEFSEQRIGLTDTIVIMEAERLKQAHKSTSLKKSLVHIWTRDNAVKVREPDTEPNPFV